jgi:hypothetical protein
MTNRLYGCARRAPIIIKIVAPQGSGKEAIWNILRDAVDEANKETVDFDYVLTAMPNDGWGQESMTLARRPKKS